LTPIAGLAHRIRTAIGTLTSTERQIAQVFLADYPMLGFESLAVFAERAGVSTTSVLRFLGKTGYQGYSDFQEALKREVQDRLQSPTTQIDKERSWAGPSDLFAKFGDPLAADIRTFFSDLPVADFEALVDGLADPKRRIFLLGGRFSKVAAQYLYLHLRQVRAHVRLIEDPESGGELLLDFGRRDLLLVFDFRRYQPDVVRFASLAHEAGCAIALVTDPWLSPVSRIARPIICCAVDSPASPFDTIVPAIAFTEALAAAVVKRMGDAGRARIASFDRVQSQLERAPGNDPAAHIPPQNESTGKVRHDP